MSIILIRKNRHLVHDRLHSSANLKKILVWRYCAVIMEKELVRSKGKIYEVDCLEVFLWGG